MKMKLVLFAVTVLSCGFSFAWPIEQRNLLSLVHNAQMPLNLQPLPFPRPPVNKTILGKCFSLFKKDVFERTIPLSSIGTAAAFLYLTKDMNVDMFDRVTGAAAACMVPQFTAGAISLFWGPRYFFGLI